MAPWRASTTKSEWLPDDPTAFAPSRLWKLLCITIWGDSQNQNLPTDSAEEGTMFCPWSDRFCIKQTGSFGSPGGGTKCRRSVMIELINRSESLERQPAIAS